MTEFSIQNKLYAWTEKKGHELMTANVRLWYPWEADFVSVTKAGYAYEYEIKCTVSDFKRDKKKKRKHNKLRRGSKSGPSRFFYAVPRSLVEAVEEHLPEHAGLITIDEQRYWPDIIEKAPRLHTNKLTKKNRRYIVRGLRYRYWQLRREA